MVHSVHKIFTNNSIINKENSENNHKKQQKQRLFKLTNVGLCGKIS